MSRKIIEQVFEDNYFYMKSNQHRVYASYDGFGSWTIVKDGKVVKRNIPTRNQAFQLARRIV